MNKITVIIVVLFLAIMGYLFYQSESEIKQQKQANTELDVDLIQPLKMATPEQDINLQKDNNTLDLSRPDRKNRRDAKVVKSQRKEKYEYPFTEEGQAYTTLGEMLLKDQNHKHTTQYTADIYKQLEQAKYNLKIAKEIATLSKTLYIDTDEGKKIDPKVYAEINKMSKNLIVTVKKQQNVQ